MGLHGIFGGAGGVLSGHDQSGKCTLRMLPLLL